MRTPSRTPSRHARVAERSAPILRQLAEPARDGNDIPIGMKHTVVARVRLVDSELETMGSPASRGLGERTDDLAVAPARGSSIFVGAGGSQ